jgi:hypothetical protein
MERHSSAIKSMNWRGPVNADIAVLRGAWAMPATPYGPKARRSARRKLCPWT